MRDISSLVARLDLRLVWVRPALLVVDMSTSPVMRGMYRRRSKMIEKEKEVLAKGVSGRKRRICVRHLFKFIDSGS